MPAVRFYGLRTPDDPNQILVGSLLLHPMGDSMVVDPDGNPSVQALVDCLAATDALHDPNGDPTDPVHANRMLARALVWKIADEIGLIDAMEAKRNETMQ